MEENMILIRYPKTFYFHFIIKSDESLAENKLKKEIEQLLLKFKHGNNIREHEKQQNQ